MNRIFFPLIMLLLGCNNNEKISTNSDKKTEMSWQVETEKMPIKSLATPKAIYLTYENNGEIGNGTGFVINLNNENYFITNWHIVTGKEVNGDFKNPTPDSICIYLSQNQNKILGYLGKEYWGELRINTKLLDIAICRFNGASQFDVSNRTVNQQVDYSFLDSCTLYGFPKSYVTLPLDSFYNKPKKIVVAMANKSIKKTLESFQDFNMKGLSEFYEVLKWDARIENGMSGSPVFNQNDQLIGVYSTLISLVHGNGEKENYGLFWNINAIKKIIEEGTNLDWSKIKN